MDCSLPGSFIHGIFQARVLEWVAISFSRGSFQPRNRTQVSCIAGRHFYRLSHQEAQGCVLQFSSILENFMSFSLFYCSPFFSSLGTSTTHILHSLKLSHSSLMLFSLLKNCFSTPCFIWIVSCCYVFKFTDSFCNVYSAFDSAKCHFHLRH